MARERGFSLAETTIILAAVTVLAATAAPSVLDYVAEARDIKAAGDVEVLTHALSRLLFDVTALKPAAGSSERPVMLVGPGDTATAAEPGCEAWLAALDGVAVHDLIDHLVVNNVGYPKRADVGFAKGWNGPYVDGVSTDPWGRRYSTNVGIADGTSSLVVLSPGPNGAVETPFRGTGLRARGDDVVGVIGSSR